MREPIKRTPGYSALFSSVESLATLSIFDPSPKMRPMGLSTRIAVPQAAGSPGIRARVARRPRLVTEELRDDSVALGPRLATLKTRLALLEESACAFFGVQ